MKTKNENKFMEKLKRFTMVALAEDDEPKLLVQYAAEEDVSRKDQKKIDSIREEFFLEVLDAMANHTLIFGK